MKRSSIRRSAALFLAALVLTACGNGPDALPVRTGQCAGSWLAGRWDSLIISDVLTVTADCMGRSSFCGQDYAFTPPTGTAGSAEVVFGKNNGNPGCADAGVRQCAYLFEGEKMTLSCGYGTLRFLKVGE